MIDITFPVHKVIVFFLTKVEYKENTFLMLILIHCFNFKKMMMNNNDIIYQQ